MPDSDKFDFDSLMDDNLPDSIDDFFPLDSEPAVSDNKDSADNPDSSSAESDDTSKTDFSAQKRSSADFSPDMDALLLTAQSSMVVEAMKLISFHDFKSKNMSVFTEAIKGIDLYMKILERNPENFKKLTSILSTDQDCMDVQKITFNLFKNVTGEFPESDSQKLKAFELINERLKNAYNKSLIASSIISIKKYFLLSGSLDPRKVDEEYKNDPAKLKSQMNVYVRNINIGRMMIKSGNYEIVKGMKGKELNVFIVKAAQLLVYYFGMIGETTQQSYYIKVHEHFKKYFIVR